MIKYRTLFGATLIRAYIFISTYILMICLVNTLSKSNYGEYRYLLSTIMLYSFFSLPEMSKTLFKYWDKEGVDDKLNIFYQLRVIGSFTGCILLSLHLFLKGYDVLYVVALSIIYWIYFVSNSIEYVYQAKKNVNRLLVILFIKNSLSLFFVSVCAYLTSDPILCAAVFFLSSSAVFLFYSIKEMGLNFFRFKWKLMVKEHRFAKEAIFLSGCNIIPIVAEHIDKILLEGYLDFEAVAIFTVAVMIGTGPNNFIKSIIGIYNKHLVDTTISLRNQTKIFFGLLFFSIIISFTLYFLPLDLLGLSEYYLSAQYAIIIILMLPFNITLYINYLKFVTNKSIPFRYVTLYNMLGPITYLCIFIFSLMVGAGSTEYMLLFCTIAFAIKPVIYLACLTLIYLFKAKA